MTSNDTASEIARSDARWETWRAAAIAGTLDRVPVYGCCDQHPDTEWCPACPVIGHELLAVIEDDDIVCPDCHGLGDVRVDDDEIADCLRCEGRGRLEVR